MSRKESSQQFEEIEKNIIKLIRIRGDKKGKVALNELAALYKSGVHKETQKTLKSITSKSSSTT